MTYGQVWWPILGIRALRLPIQSEHTQQWTHTHREHTPGAVGSHLCCGTREAVGGSVPCSKFTSVVVLRRALDIHSPHLQFLPARDSNSQTFDYESDSLTYSCFYLYTDNIIFNIWIIFKHWFVQSLYTPPMAGWTHYEDGKQWVLPGGTQFP